PFGMNRDRMALMMAAYRFLTAPDDLDRTAQSPCRQRQDDLNGHIFTSAESPAYGRVNDTDLLVGQAQSVRNLFLVLVNPLTGNNNRNTTVFVNVGKPGFRLQISVFLPGSFISAFDNNIGWQPASRHIAFANAIVAQDVVRIFGMELRCVVLDGFFGGSDNGQIFINNFDEIAGCTGSVFGFRDNDSHVIG